MAAVIRPHPARYGLLLFAPYPEREERVCVGIWFDDGRTVSLASDPEFHRLRCIAPEFSPRFVMTILDDLDHALRSSSSSAAEFMMRQYEPQLIATKGRTLTATLTPELRDQIREKFLLPRRSLTLTAAETPSAGIRPSVQEQIHQHVKEYVVDLLPPAMHLPIREHVSLRDILRVGDAFRNPTAALAVEMPRRIVVIDGVDLKLLSPKQAVDKANDIVHSFWQFRRAREQQQQASGILFAEERVLRRVAIVLNGTPKPHRARREAHDYAVDKLRSESEVMVDTASSEGRDDLIRELTV